MKTCGIFTVHYFPIPFENWNEPFYLIPFGDVHRDSPLCHERKWKEFLERAHKESRAYFLGMGDYNDLLSSSERKILTNPELHDSTSHTIDEVLMDRIYRFYDEIKFMRGRVIGLLGGNHYGTFETGITTDQKLAELLGCAFLGVTSFIRLALQKTHSRKATSVDVWAYHGRGAARLTGGSLNTVEQMSNLAEADIFLMGHDHKKPITFVDKLRLVGQSAKLRLRERKVLLARTGSFLKGYVPGERSYVVDAGMRPNSLGVIKIELTPRRISTGSHRREQFDEEIYTEIRVST